MLPVGYGFDSMPSEMMEHATVPRKIVVLNTKGGSGKTTIATNLAAYYAWRGGQVALMDLDPQGSSMRWLRQRPPEAPLIHGIAGYEKRLNVTRAFALRSPPGTEYVVVDTPAALPATQMPDTVRDASAIIVPVLPSDIDIHAASRCIADLLLVAKVHRSERRLVIVANRARRYTKAFQSLMRFLQSLRIPVAAVLRDSQAYIRSAETGLGLHEMKGALLQEDLDSWKPLVEWLERRSGAFLPGAEDNAPGHVPAVEEAVDAPAGASAVSSLYWPAGR
jgi:chromosome partitioning protein